MQSFEQLINTINNYYDSQNNICSLVQVTVKNYDQLCAIATEEELQAIDTAILNTVNNCCRSSGLLKIFEYNKFYYCLLTETDPAELSIIAANIHTDLICKLDYDLFADARLIATKLYQGIDTIKAFRLLCDKVHYVEDNKIFYWIENPQTELIRLEKEYSNLLELRKAVANRSACFAFQPIIKCDSGEVAYHECLLRLSNSDHKLISAGSYIMLAERYGYITAVDKYVFEMAVEELKSTSDVSLSINISNIGVQDKLLVSHIDKLISNSGVGPRMIIEITETAINDNYAQTKYFVDRMKSLGCKIALDDFGAGYTSFNQLRDFAVDIIKIDGSFVRDITTNNKNRILVETLIKTAEEIGCKTVAEFVENGGIAKQLIDLKVDYMQGNFFSPAVNYRSWEKF